METVMLLKRLLPIVLLFLSQLVFAETEFLTTYTDVESFVDAQKRLGRSDVSEADLTRTHYVVEKDLTSQKIIIRPLQLPQSVQHTTLPLNMATTDTHSHSLDTN
jgi:hypothetical protein